LISILCAFASLRLNIFFSGENIVPEDLSDVKLIPPTSVKLPIEGPTSALTRS
jgi:hypothetical protein